VQRCARDIHVRDRGRVPGAWKQRQPPGPRYAAI
jgi:hypothetical protein